MLVHASLLCRLFSRVEPAHKSLIVEYLQEDGNVCAMVRMQREEGGRSVGRDGGEDGKVWQYDEQ